MAPRVQRFVRTGTAIAAASGVTLVALAAVEPAVTPQRDQDLRPSAALVTAASRTSPTWGPAELVGLRRPTGDYDPATVAVRGSRTEAVWDVPAPHRPGSRILRTAVRRPDGGWTPPTSITRVRRELESYDLTLGPQGRALLVWTAIDDRGSSVMASDRDAHGSWSPAHRLGRGSTSADSTAVVDPDGAMTVVWESWTDDGPGIAWSAKDGEGWSDPQLLEAGGYGDAVVAGNRHGRHVAAWSTAGGLAVATSRADGTWGPVHVVRHRIGNADPSVVIDDLGRVLAMASRSTEDEDYGGRRHLAWAWSRADGSWTPSAYLDSRSGEVLGTDLSLAMSRRGRALAVWRTDRARGSDVSAARFRPGRGWTAPRRLTHGSFEPVHAMLTPGGTAATLLGDVPRTTATAWGYQRPGRPWQLSRVRLGYELLDTAAGPHRMTVVYNAARLHARVLHVPDAGR